MPGGGPADGKADAHAPAIVTPDGTPGISDSGKPRPLVTGCSTGSRGAEHGQREGGSFCRSAYLCQKAEARSRIDLSSRRVRRALALLDVLKKGLTLEEALGLRGERWLHDNKLSRLTFDLRRVFPFVN